MKIHIIKSTVFAAAGLMALVSAGQAASVLVTVSQSASGAEGSTPIDLTALGTLDWGIWATPNTVALSDSMNGGVGFTSLALIGGAAQSNASFGNPQNGYGWTNGTNATTASNITNAARAELTGDGRGVRLTINTTTAGSYRLVFYTSTSGAMTIGGTASLATGGVTSTAPGAARTDLAKSEYTVDFTTDGADTLTLDVTRTGGTNNVFSYEAFTLASVPEPSSAALLGILGGLALLRRCR